MWRQCGWQGGILASSVTSQAWAQESCPVLAAWRRWLWLALLWSHTDLRSHPGSATCVPCGHSQVTPCCHFGFLNCEVEPVTLQGCAGD